MPRIVTAAVSNRFNPSIGSDPFALFAGDLGDLARSRLFRYLQDRTCTRSGKIPEILAYRPPGGGGVARVLRPLSATHVRLGILQRCLGGSSIGCGYL
jgi:hypothetical protein